MRNLTVQYVNETQEILEFHPVEKTSGMCRGESGSGLFIKEGKKQIVVGITTSVEPGEISSGVVTCALGPSSRLKFAAIYPHLNWIVENAFESIVV